MSKKLPSQTYHDIDINIDHLRNKLKLKSFKEKAALVNKYPHVAKFLGAGVIASTLLLAAPHQTGLAGSSSTTQPKTQIVAAVNNQNPNATLVSDMASVLPARTQPLTQTQEKKLEVVISSLTGVSAKATLEGEHLNTTYGLIGAEQHLRRYPGDTMAQQTTDPTLAKEGMAPGLGAWGYFAPSKALLTPDLVEKEKWYAVVQTLYLPDWSKRLAYLRDWYKYRKVLIVNTKNGNAVVADVADSGPAAWTGKSFGGSPEVMDALGGPRYKVGPVLLFFVDDPNNKVPLGPVNYNEVTNIAGVSFVQS
jgi:hypothetical protein